MLIDISFESLENGVGAGLLSSNEAADLEQEGNDRCEREEKHRHRCSSLLFHSVSEPGQADRWLQE